MVAGSAQAWLITQIGIQGQRYKLTPNQALWFFGEGLHTLQDSYSHQGRPVSQGVGHSRGYKQVFGWYVDPATSKVVWASLYDLNQPLSGPAAAVSESADDDRLYRSDAIQAGLDTWSALMQFRAGSPQFFSGPAASEAMVTAALNTYFPRVPIAFRAQPARPGGPPPRPGEPWNRQEPPQIFSGF